MSKRTNKVKRIYTCVIDGVTRSTVKDGLIVLMLFSSTGNTCNVAASKGDNEKYNRFGNYSKAREAKEFENNNLVN